MPEKRRSQAIQCELEVSVRDYRHSASASIGSFGPATAVYLRALARLQKNQNNQIRMTSVMKVTGCLAVAEGGGKYMATTRIGVRVNFIHRRFKFGAGTNDCY
jgi:hypothetical protein